MTTVVRVDQWIRRYDRADPGAPRLVCFPHAGGAANFYYGFAKALSPTVEVLAVQYPGRQDRHREGQVESVCLLADQITAELAVYTDRPLAFFGHSMGAVVAFEVARRLETGAGIELVAMFASARRAPSCTRSEAIHLLPDSALIAELRSMNGTDARLLDDEELIRMILPAVRADYKAIETYHAQSGAAIRSPLIALAGDADPHVTQPEAAAWREHTTAPFALHLFSGGHFYLLDHLPRVLEIVSSTVVRR